MYFRTCTAAELEVLVVFPLFRSPLVVVVGYLKRFNQSAHSDL